jgi:hypothetical protein
MHQRGTYIAFIVPEKCRPPRKCGTTADDVAGSVEHEEIKSPVREFWEWFWYLQYAVILKRLLHPRVITTHINLLRGVSVEPFVILLDGYR